MYVLPKLPVAHWINVFVQYLSQQFGAFFNWITFIIHTVVHAVDGAFLALPWWLLILLLVTLAYFAGRWKLAIGTLIGLVFVYDMRLWYDFVTTLVLVLTAALISTLIGLPLGIQSARKERVYRALAPVLDLMQTMPSFVYLVPVLLFFNIGMVPAMIATIIFSMPPVIRLTRLGILQVPENIIEAARAFGSSDRQLLWKVQIPLAMQSIKAGINQTLMLSLSMVVIAAMVGASGLGSDVLSALENINVGKGFEAGIAIVILAIILDRVSQNLHFQRKRKPVG